jgi:hypothetical protein
MKAVRQIGQLAILCALTAAGGARAQLSGELRTRFIVRFERACISSADQDERLVGASHKVLASICRCAGGRMADTLDIDEMKSATARNELPQWSTDWGTEAVEYCIDRKGGFIPGMTITPNH